MSEYTAGLRAMADWLDAHPEYTPANHLGVRIPVMFDGANVKAQLASFARALGHAEKRTIGRFFEVYRRFGPHEITAFEYQELVCERVVVGTETVEEPDPEALAAVPTRTVERELVEWVCPPLLASAPDAAGQDLRGAGVRGPLLSARPSETSR